MVEDHVYSRYAIKYIISISLKLAILQGARTQKAAFQALLEWFPLICVKRSELSHFVSFLIKTGLSMRIKKSNEISK